MSLNKFISRHGYKRNSPDKNKAFNIIPSGNITMKDVDFPVKGTDDLGNSKMMYPGEDYVFPGSIVYEQPFKQDGGQNYPDEYEAMQNDYIDTELSAEEVENLRAQGYDVEEL